MDADAPWSTVIDDDTSPIGQALLYIGAMSEPPTVELNPIDGHTELTTFVDIIGRIDGLHILVSLHAHEVCEKSDTGEWIIPKAIREAVEASGDQADSHLIGEIDGLKDGQRALESQPWYPARDGDVLHVHYETNGALPEFGETYRVENSEEHGGLVLALMSHTAKDTDDVGWYSPGVAGDPLAEPWFEAGPAQLTLIRDGRVVHGGTR
ncbi:hypothetical protein DQ384_26050 [Sphaerisporangium album]|uniref:Uncharacterized protein n=1 Tax=Sphaerisporangium album TaxID=509200 RepID=A0A367FBX0_9ACTN|nr:hypothetical protein [Sphaerisporangium album]RCG27185.1 hypothetical protein DQ384_26050 [Sphaerisporangium album]